MSWAWTTDDRGVEESAPARATAMADGKNLAWSSANAVENAAAIAGVIALDAVLDDGRYWAAADTLFQTLLDDF